MIRKVLAANLLALIVGHPAWADSWLVSVDTSSIIGQTGYLDFQFNPADLSAPVASATLTGFSTDGILAAVVPSGDATGNLTSTLALGNSQFFNDWLQGYTFGSTLSFMLDIDVPVPNASGSGSAFSLSLYDSNYASLLANPDWGASLVVNASDNGHFDILAKTEAITVTSPVPEPDPYILMLSSLGLIAFAVRRGRAP